MPYIKQGERERFDELIENLVIELIKEQTNIHGNMNYCIFKLVKYVLGNNYHYKDLQDMIGMLECCKQEVIRRLINPYEDKKIEENGDVK